MDPLLGKTKPESRRTELESRKTELGLGKAEPRPSYGCGLQEELKPTSGKEGNEESVTKKSKSGNIGSPVDEEKMEPMKEYDSVKGGGTIQIDWRLPLLECIRGPG
jgi:hypothetical protein